MKAYASLHTGAIAPTTQTENEVSYTGYQRAEVDFHDKIGNPPVKVLFPTPSGSGVEKITHMLIGESPTGDGAVGLVIKLSCPVEIIGGEEMSVKIINIAADSNGGAMDVILPLSVHHIARCAYYLHMAGVLNPETLHPTLYEAINNELHKNGIEVIPVARGGAANMVQALGWGLGDLCEVETQH